MQTWLLPAPISSVTPSRHGSVQVGNKHYGWGRPCRVWVKFTWMITLSGLLGRERRGSRIFTQTLAKRLIFPTRLFASETWVGLGNFSCEAVCIRRIMWALFFSSLYFIFAFFLHFTEVHWEYWSTWGRFGAGFGLFFIPFWSGDMVSVSSVQNSDPKKTPNPLLRACLTNISPWSTYLLCTVQLCSCLQRLLLSQGLTRGVGVTHLLLMAESLPLQISLLYER